MRVLDILRPPLIAIDVGTATTRVSWGPGEVYERPSVACEKVHGRTVVRLVLRGGIVTDIAGVAGVVGTLLAARRPAWRRRPAAVVCAPTDASAQDRKALVKAVAAAGASVVAVVPEPLADGRPFTTDGCHYIADCAVAAIADRPALQAQLASIVGVVESGLFIGLASMIVIGRKTGVEVISK